jgi:hypothetical protein
VGLACPAGRFSALSDIPVNIPTVLGFSTGTAVAAKGITASYVQAGKVTKTGAPDATVEFAVPAADPATCAEWTALPKAVPVVVSVMGQQSNPVRFTVTGPSKARPLPTVLMVPGSPPRLPSSAERLPAPVFGINDFDLPVRRRTQCSVLLTITTTRAPATDLGYLLHKHPDLT